MALTDRYGLNLSTAQPAARDAYVEGCDLLLTLYPGALAAFDQAIAEDPGFALAYAGRARALQVAGDAVGAKAAIAAAQALMGGTCERECGHIAVLRLMIDGKTAEALEAVRGHVAVWPRDALVVSLAASQTGLISTSGRSGREQDQHDFLAALAAAYGDDWWFNGHYAMALSELGHQAHARALIEQSIARYPRNATAAHAMAHFHYETGEPMAAIGFLQSWLATYPREGGLHGHLNWHLALVLLQQGDLEAGLQLYSDAFAAETYHGPALVKLMDAPSYLWRAELAGHPRDAARWQALQAFAHQAFPRPGVAYADWHVALIDAVVADTSAQARVQEIENLIDDGRYAAGPAVPAMARAFAAFQQHDFNGAIAAIEPVFSQRERMSGSRAQIDLIEFTLLKSYLAAGRLENARRLIQSRRPGPRGIPVAGLEAASLH